MVSSKPPRTPPTISVPSLENQLEPWNVSDGPCAQTNTNLLELELNDSETPVSRTVYLISVANSQSRCTFNYIFLMFLLSNLCLYFIVIM